MKVTQKIFSFLVLAAAVLTGCERDYDAPPLNEPVYEGPSANITIADLKENCKNATQETPIEITNDWVLKAYVTGNDESGNIYKQVIVQDETGAMPIQVDENNVSNFYRRGQEVFVNLYMGMNSSWDGLTGARPIVCRLLNFRRVSKRTDGRMWTT